MEQASAWADVLAAGPGLGQSPEALQKLKALLAAAGGKPVVLDGDALNLLAKEPELRSYKTGSWILTPHPGELDGFWGRGTEEVLADLPEAARQLAAAYGCIAVCKDAATVCALPDGQIWVNTAGNDGMATAGSGTCWRGLRPVFWRWEWSRSGRHLRRFCSTEKREIFWQKRVEERLLWPENCRIR